MLGSRDLSDPELARHMPPGSAGTGRCRRSRTARWGCGCASSTGYRAVSPRFLVTVPWVRAADDLLFDQETMIQAHRLGLRIAEVVLPSRYFVHASPVGLDSVRYGLSTIGLLARDRVHRIVAGRWRLLQRAWHADVSTGSRRKHRHGSTGRPAGAPDGRNGGESSGPAAPRLADVHDGHAGHAIRTTGAGLQAARCRRCSPASGC